MSAHYNCPVCGEKMARDLLALDRHASEHIVQEIKKTHPAWVTKDGYCPTCLDYFKHQMGKGDGAFKAPPSNITPKGVRRRQAIALACFVGAAGMTLALKMREFPPIFEALIFIPLFGGFLCWTQSRERVCVVLAGLGKKETVQGSTAVDDAELLKALKDSASRIFLISAALAAVITLLAILF